MPFYPITLSDIRAARDRRVQGNQNRRPGMLGVSNRTPAASESLNIEVSGVQREVFIFGVDDPDDADADRYIP